MAHWVLATLVALFASCITTGEKSNHPTTQTQIPRQESASLFVAQPISRSGNLMQVHYGRQRASNQCDSQPNIMWCAGYREFHEPLTEETIKTADKRVRVNFTYVSDIVDTWRVHSDSVMNTRAWEGDCDDLATTALDMLARQGQPLDRMWLVLVAATLGNKLGGRLDHLIAVVEDDTGRFWVVGDTSRETVELKEMTYRPLVYMSTSDRVWNEAETNGAFALQFGVESWMEAWNSRNGETRSRQSPGFPFPNEVPVKVENR